MVEGPPSGSLALNLGHHVLLLGFTAISHDCRIAIRILLWCIHQISIFGVYFISVRYKLRHQWCTGFTLPGELAGGQKQSAGPVTQHIGVINLLTLQLRHRHRVHFGWSRFTVFQQLACILALTVGTAEELAEPARLELHFRATLVAFNAGAIIALDAEAALLHFIARTVRVVATHMQLALLVDQVGVHGRITELAAMLVAQNAGFLFIIPVHTDDFIARDQVDGALAAFLGRQVVA